MEEQQMRYFLIKEERQFTSTSKSTWLTGWWLLAFWLEAACYCLYCCCLAGWLLTGCWRENYDLAEDRSFRLSAHWS